MIAPRATRLVRTADLRAFRAAIVELASMGDPIEARDRLLILPTRAAAGQLLRTLEDATLGEGGALLRPDIATPGELVTRLAWRLDQPPAVLTDAEREVLLGMACRAAQAAGVEPPFRMRPALVAEALAFYDELRRNRKDVDAFERLVLGMLEPSASYDRGAARLVQQTAFLAAAFRDFESRCAAHGLDEHGLRTHLLTAASSRPYRHVVVAVTSRAFASHGLPPADWDLLSRVPGIERLDVVVTDRTLVGAPHEWFHSTLPGIEEVRVGDGPAPGPTRLVPSEGTVVHVARDREEEVSDFARRVRAAVRNGEVSSIERVALVVRQPLPYLYLGREVCRAASMPCQSADALPLAAEPLAAALDLLVTCAASAYARDPLIALCRSPHFDFGAGHEASVAAGLTALDRALSEAGHLGEIEGLERLIAALERDTPEGRSEARAVRAARTALGLCRELEPLRTDRSVAAHLTTLLDVWRRHERLSLDDGPSRSRLLRARGALLGLLTELRDAHARFDDAVVSIDDVSALIRRSVEARTFASPSDRAGLHIVDAASAPFGAFEFVQLAGLVDGEWPSATRHDTFYSWSVLRELGWPAESDRLEGTRAAFDDLLRLPARWLAVSSFRLEMDSLVTPSPLVDELDASDQDRVEIETHAVRIFDHEALSLAPIAIDALPARAAMAARHRGRLPNPAAPRFHGVVEPRALASFSPGGLEQYQDCPFKFFARRVLRLEEPPDDGSTLSPRARGRLIHDIFQRFFDAWDARGGGPITPDRVPDARALLVEVAEPVLDRLPESERLLERARFFGSPVAPGAADVVLGLEASRPAHVVRRWLEHEFNGAFTLGREDGRRVPLRGIADRIDLLDDGRLRVMDYKTGRLYDRARALQVPIYALCAREQLTDADGRPRDVAEAGYVTFADKRPFTAVVDGTKGRDAAALVDAGARVYALVDRLEQGEFPPRPHDPMRCRFCAYATVCRKDYVDDE